MRAYSRVYMSLPIAARTVSVTSSALGQMSLRNTGLPVTSGAERVGGEIDVEASRERVRNHERWRGEICGAHLRMDPALEVAVAAEHCGDGEVLGLDALGDLFGERSAIADARGAAVAHEVEAKLLEGAEQSRPLEVVGDHA